MPPKKSNKISSPKNDSLESIEGSNDSIIEESASSEPKSSNGSEEPKLVKNSTKTKTITKKNATNTKNTTKKVKKVKDDTDMSSLQDMRDENFPADDITIKEDEEPTTSKWFLSPLYKENKYWQIGFDGIDSLIIRHGTIGGIITINNRKVVPKAKRSMAVQSLNEARSQYTAQCKKKLYHLAGENVSQDPQPMLANNWVPKSKMNNAKDLLIRYKIANGMNVKVKSTKTIVNVKNVKMSAGKSDLDLSVKPTESEMAAADLVPDKKNVWKLNAKWRTTDGPVMAKIKYDGMRALAKKDDNGDVIIRSRENTILNNLNMIENDISSLFKYLPKGTQLDGELYSLNIDFNSLMSIIKKAGNNRIGEVKYYIFDIITIEPMGALNRYNTLMEAVNKVNIERKNDTQTKIDNYFDPNPNPNPNQVNKSTIIPSYYEIVGYEVANSDDEILALHDKYVAQGYEGIMILQLSGPKSFYENKRCDNLLKYKEFIDEEATIIDVIEGEGTEVGLALFLIRDQRKNEFVVRPRGSFVQRKKWIDKRQNYINKKLTFRYQGLSEDQVPRFPVGIGIRDYE